MINEKNYVITIHFDEFHKSLENHILDYFKYLPDNMYQNLTILLNVYLQEFIYNTVLSYIRYLRYTGIDFLTGLNGSKLSDKIYSLIKGKEYDMDKHQQLMQHLVHIVYRYMVNTLNGISNQISIYKNNLKDIIYKFNYDDYSIKITFIIEKDD